MLSAIPDAPSRRFDPRLESMRGVAAFAVVACHALAALSVREMTLPLGEQSASALVTSVISAVFNVNAAVILFFVLSGDVLSLSLGARNGAARLPHYPTK
jgi:peptidoglycan/LPS O-acetylase OafA/YrhL